MAGIANTGAKDEAQAALFRAVAQGVKDVEELNGYTVAEQSKRLIDLALAYRYAAGGAQPGSAADS